MEVGTTKNLGTVLAALAIAQGAWAGETIRLRKGLVVPVQFQDDLSLRDNRRGDRFSAVVRNDRDLPAGSVLHGHIEDMDRSRGDRPGFMELRFDTIQLPDGAVQEIEAVPIRMDDKTIKLGSDGRFTAKRKVEDTGKHVLGGMAGGFLIGKILGHKEKEGILLGALAGIIAGEADRNSTASETVVRRDSRMGALIRQETTIELGARRIARGDPNLRPDLRPSADGRGIVIEYQNRELRFEGDQQPYREGDTWMVPLQATARQIGMSVDDANSRRIFVEDDDTVLIFEQDSRNFRLNGRRAELPETVKIRDNVIYVPIDAILAAKNGQIKISRTELQRTT